MMCHAPVNYGISLSQNEIQSQSELLRYSLMPTQCNSAKCHCEVYFDCSNTKLNK